MLLKRSTSNKLWPCNKLPRSKQSRKDLLERKPSLKRFLEKKLNTRNSLNSKNKPLSKKDKPL